MKAHKGAAPRAYGARNEAYGKRRVKGATVGAENQTGRGFINPTYANLPPVTGRAGSTNEPTGRKLPTNYSSILSAPLRLSLPLRYKPPVIGRAGSTNEPTGRKTPTNYSSILSAPLNVSPYLCVINHPS